MYIFAHHHLSQLTSALTLVLNLIILRWARYDFLWKLKAEKELVEQMKNLTVDKERLKDYQAKVEDLERKKQVRRRADAGTRARAHEHTCLARL